MPRVASAFWIELDAHRVLLRAVDLNLRHPADRRDLLASRFSAYSATVDSGSVDDESTIFMIGASARVHLLRCVVWAWASMTAASAPPPRSPTARLRRGVDAAVERELHGDRGNAVGGTEVIVSMPAMVEKLFLKGVATGGHVVRVRARELRLHLLRREVALGNALIGSNR